MNDRDRRLLEQYLTKEEFSKFRDNHFAHLVSDVKHVLNDVKWIRVILFVILASVVGSKLL